VKVGRRRVRIRWKWVTWEKIEKEEKSKEEKSELAAREKEREDQNFE